jgi:BTB/POZ domain-containing protein KCTD9
MGWRSQYHYALWRADLRVQVGKILQVLPPAPRDWPIFRWPVLFILIIGQTLNRLAMGIQQSPNWLVMGLTVSFLAGMAVWLNDIEIKSLSDPFSSKAIKAVFDNAESIAISAAVILYFKEAPDRKTQRHYTAVQMLDIAAAGKLPTSYGRKIALETLAQDKFLLHGLDAPNADLAGIRLANADLQRANLNEAHLNGAILTQANLTNANLEITNLAAAHLEGAILASASLFQANLQAANLQSSNLANATLMGANLEHANLEAANLYKTNLKDAVLWGANLRNARLEGANLDGADLEAANLQGAKLQVAQWQNARLCRTILPDGSESNRDCPVGNNDSPTANPSPNLNQ